MASALDQVESAVTLLRNAGLPALVRHWTGSVPFAFGMLIFWRTITGYRVSDATCAGAALGMTALLVWMSCWRASFAVQLRRRLHGESPVPATVGTLGGLVRNQAAAAGIKLVLLPLAAAAVVPIAWTVAFFRNLAAFSDLEAHDGLSRARKLAGFESRNNWTALAIFSLLGVVVFVNVAIALALIPQLTKALTGYESAFSKSGASFILNRLYFLAVALITWVAVDPLIQAYYCVRCFLGESLDTGADLRARLRLIRTAAEASVPILLLFVLSIPAVAAVTAPEFDQSVARTLQSSEYDWRLAPAPSSGTQGSWLVNFTDRIMSEVRRLLRAIGRLIDEVIRWLLDKPTMPLPEGAPSASVLTGGLRVLILLAALAAAGAFWRFRFFRRPAPPAVTPLPVVDLHDESLTADRLPEERWYELGEQCLARGDFRAALRAFFLGNLAWLNSRRLIALDPGKTNREYDRELRRRGRAVVAAPPLLTANIDVFERSWYGRYEAAAADIELFRDRLRRMKEMLAQ